MQQIQLLVRGFKCVDKNSQNVTTVIQLVANKVGHLNFGNPIFTKERPSSGVDFLGKYGVTKVWVSHFVCK